MSEASEQGCAVNTDREVWSAGIDYRDERVHITAGNGIGISVGGRTVVRTAEAWHALAICATSEPAPVAAEPSADDAEGAASPEYQRGFNRALELAPVAAEPVKPMFAASAARRKWESLQSDGYRMQSIRFEGNNRAGTIDPWGKVLWGATPAAAMPAEPEQP